MNAPVNADPPASWSRPPWVAGLLNLILPGLGNIFSGQDNKGIFLIGMALLGQWSSGGLSSLVLCPVMAVDAFLIARKRNRGGTPGRWEFFPGVRFLNALPARIILLGVVVIVAATMVLHIRQFAAGEAPSTK